MKENNQIFSVNTYVTHLITISKKMGIHIEIYDDFNEYLDLCNNIDKKSPGTSQIISYQFHPDYCNLNDDSGFWIKGVNESNEVVHVQALKIADLRLSNVHEYLSSMKIYFDKPEKMAAHGAKCNVFAETARSMNGQVCYHGEIWVRKDFRGQRLASVLPRLALALAYQKWSPDYVLGLVTDGLLSKGLAAQYGYFRAEEYVTFDVPEDNVHLNEWLIWVSRETFHDMVNQLEVETQYIKHGSLKNLQAV